jgi:predicted Zn-dependent protease
VAVNRILALVLCLTALIAGWLVYSRSSVQPTASALPPKVENRKIYFVPIGNFPDEQLPLLVEYYRKKYNLEIEVAGGISVDPATRDAQRQQLMAENLAASIRKNVSEPANDPNAILIGFTAEDIYPTSQNWQFAFGWRDGEMHTAVVSTARLSLADFAQPMTPDTPATRLRKIVTKDIGILYYGLPQSQSPKSVLYNQIMGIEELDSVGEDF